MESLVKKYSDKLVNQKLCSHGMPLLGAMDDEIIWNRDGDEIPVLEEVIDRLNINSILFSEIAEPYGSMINFLARFSRDGKGVIRPDDTETRTFLHDIPVVENFTVDDIVSSLKKRKGVIVAGRGIVTYGVVSPEQAFVFFSSICFSCYVKFMTDFSLFKRGLIDPVEDPTSIAINSLRRYRDHINSLNLSPRHVEKFNNSEEVIESMIETGRLTVESGMVDSFFGNISAKFGETIYISQTGSSLDELRGLIDPCPMDNSMSNAITSSSEFSAHKSIYSNWNHKTILHGHPKYSVILSLICEEVDCPNRKLCHINCSKKRMAGDIPIIPGEVGTGPKGIATTLPPAMGGRGAIVYGHGLFTAGKDNFTDAFENLIHIERMCFNMFLENHSISLT